MSEQSRCDRPWNASCNQHGRSVCNCGVIHSASALEAKMKSILDPSFRYTKSVETDLRKTFARVRRELRKHQQDQSTASAELTRKVLSFHVRKAGL